MRSLVENLIGLHGLPVDDVYDIAKAQLFRTEDARRLRLCKRIAIMEVFMLLSQDYEYDPEVLAYVVNNLQGWMRQFETKLVELGFVYIAKVFQVYYSAIDDIDLEELINVFLFTQNQIPAETADFLNEYFVRFASDTYARILNGDDAKVFGG